MRKIVCILLLARAPASMCCAANAAAREPQEILRVASLMLKPVPWDKQANRELLEAAIREAKGQGAELIVTP